jgi:hypothetical protein
LQENFALLSKQIRKDVEAKPQKSRSGLKASR